MPDLPDKLKLRGLMITEWTYEVESGWYEDCDTIEEILAADQEACNVEPWAFVGDDPHLDHVSIEVAEDRGPIILWPDGRVERMPVGWTP